MIMMTLFSVRECIRGALLFVFVLMFVAGSRSSRLHDPEQIINTRGEVLYLHEGVNLEELVDHLDSLQVVPDRGRLLWAGRMFGWRQFPPGRYEIPRRSNADTFLAEIARGHQDPGEITILPGITPERLAGSLGRDLMADSVAFMQLFQKDSSLNQEFGWKETELFSRMLPNTYNVYWTSSPEAVVRRILDEFEREVEVGLRQEINASDLTLDEALVLASIVEWEAKVRSEKRRISGLYLNRLNRRMRLQADPTVAYAIGEKRRLLYEDYEVDHPYNTYRINGLPPGAITNPALETIRAVLDPEEHDYLYMVAQADGTHAFNTTYAGHLESSRLWRNFLREQERIRRQREREEEEK